MVGRAGDLNKSALVNAFSAGGMSQRTKADGMTSKSSKSAMPSPKRDIQMIDNRGRALSS